MRKEVQAAKEKERGGEESVRLPAKLKLSPRDGAETSRDIGRYFPTSREKFSRAVIE